MYSYSYFGADSGRTKSRIHLTSAVQKLGLSYFGVSDTGIFRLQFILMIGNICTVEVIPL